MPPAVHRKGFVEGFFGTRFDCAAILKINAAVDFEVVVQVNRLRRVLYDEIPCAAADKAEIRPYVIRVLERMAEILHKLAAHAADTAQEFLVLHIVNIYAPFLQTLRSVMLGRERPRGQAAFYTSAPIILPYSEAKFDGSTENKYSVSVTHASTGTIWNKTVPSPRNASSTADV